MRFTNEQLAKAKAAQSAEEIMELAKAEGIEMTADEAARAFAATHEPPIGELSDEELENVAGGGCGSDPKPKYEVGDIVWVNIDGRRRARITEVKQNKSSIQYTLRYFGLSKITGNVEEIGEGTFNEGFIDGKAE